VAIRGQAEGLDAIKRAWYWWLGELSPLVPKKLSSILSGSQAVLTISEEGGQSRFELKFGNVSKLVGVADIESFTDWDLQEFRDSMWLGLPSSLRVEVILPVNDVLSREIFLPLAAEHNLSTVLQYEIDRFTPFKKDDACIGYRIMERYIEREKIRVELYAVQKGKLSSLLEKLKLLGLNPSAIFPNTVNSENTPGTMNLLMPSQRAVLEPLWNPRVKQLAAISLALLIAVFVFPSWQLERTAISLHSDLAQIRIEANRVSEKQSDITVRLLAQKAIISRKNQSPDKLQLLYDLTSLLPDNTWVSRLKIDEKGVTLQGESGKASDLIELLEQFKRFENVRFNSPVTRNPTTNKEQYEIQMELTGGAI